MSKKRRNRQRDEPASIRATPVTTSIMISDPAAHDILFPEGYTPLSKNEDILQCVNQIANRVSNMTIMLMENGENGDRRIKNELSYKLDVCPSKTMNRKLFLFCIVRDMCVSGNCICVPQYKNDLLDNIVLIPSSDYSILPDGIGGYYIQYGSIRLMPDEILNFVLNPDSREPYRGQGIAPLIKNRVRNLLQAQTTKEAFLQSKWKPSLIISVRSDIEELQDPKKRDKILDTYLSNSEQGKPWMIPADEIKVDTVKPLTLNDLAIQDGITLDKKVIAAAIGVPGFMVGVGDFNKEEYNNFISTTVMDYAQIIQQELTRGLILSHSWYFKLNVKSLMQYSLAEKSSFVNGMVEHGMINKNEGRNEFDYSPVDKPGMNDYSVLENYIPVETIGKQKKLIQDVIAEEGES